MSIILLPGGGAAFESVVVPDLVIIEASLCSAAPVVSACETVLVRVGDPGGVPDGSLGSRVRLLVLLVKSPSRGE